MNADQYPEDEGRVLLNDLPDELLIQIFSRLTDPKHLCLCSLVTPRFSSLILLNVHSVSFTVTTDPIPTADSLAQKTLRFVRGVVSKPVQYFRQSKRLPSSISAASFLSKFKSIRSLQCVAPTSPHNCSHPNDDSIYKWAATFGPTIETFVFFTASSIGVKPGQRDLRCIELTNRRIRLASDCLHDALDMHRLLCGFIRDHPLLENITITDSNNHGSLSVRDSKVGEMRNWLNSSSQTHTKLNKIEVPIIHHSYFPVVKLLGSGKVMMNATLMVGEMVHRRHDPRDWSVEAALFASLFSEQGEEEIAEAIGEMFTCLGFCSITHLLRPRFFRLIM